MLSDPNYLNVNDAYACIENDLETITLEITAPHAHPTFYHWKLWQTAIRNLVLASSIKIRKVTLAVPFFCPLMGTPGQPVYQNQVALRQRALRLAMEPIDDLLGFTASVDENSAAPEYTLLVWEGDPAEMYNTVRNGAAA